MLRAVIRVVQRHLIPAFVASLYYSIRYRCAVSPKASVQLNNRISFGKGTVVKPFAVIQTSGGRIRFGKNCAISSFNQLSLFVPSRKAQQEVWTLNRKLFLEPGTAALQLANQIGLSKAVISNRRQQLIEPVPDLYLELAEWLESPLADGQAPLHVSRETTDWMIRIFLGAV